MTKDGARRKNTERNDERTFLKYYQINLVECMLFVEDEDMQTLDINEYRAIEDKDYYRPLDP